MDLHLVSYPEARRKASRLGLRLHRLLSSVGSTLTESEWIDKVGERHVHDAKILGLLTEDIDSKR